jgi:hypothetical protein
VIKGRLKITHTNSLNSISAELEGDYGDFLELTYSDVVQTISALEQVKKDWDRVLKWVEFGAECE